MLHACALRPLNNSIMKKLDTEFTSRLQTWLNTPPEKRDIGEGAKMYLQLTRNQALYNTVMRKPDKFHKKLEYELRKLLKIRLDKLTMADVARLESEIMPKAAETVGESMVLSVDDELPEGMTARGKRMDHASLPENIRELWDSNGERYKKIVLLFNELKGMSDSAPCDRYEKLKILAELDRIYRHNLELYDNYVAADADSRSCGSSESLRPDFPSVQAGTPSDSPASTLDSASAADVARKINAARKLISSNKKVLAKMDASDPMLLRVRDKIQEAVDTVRTLGGSFADRQKTELVSLGITLD